MDIIQIAEECQFTKFEANLFKEQLQAFADRLLAEQRERDAKICDDLAIEAAKSKLSSSVPMDMAYIYAAAAIRKGDDGPDFPDGHDSEGFPGGCERFGCLGGDKCTGGDA